jgi:acetyl esterase/lipase
MARYEKSRHETASLRLFIATALFLLSLLAVMPAQTYNLWKASIAGAEWGHYVALAGIVMLLVPFWWRSVMGQLAGGLTVVAIGIAISPTIRAMNAGRGLQSRLDAAFGQAVPRGNPGAAVMEGPVSIARMIRNAAPEPASVRSLNYVTREGGPLALDFYDVRDSTDSAAKDSSSTRPLVITIHGGSWVGGSRTDLPELNHYLAARGYAVAALSYRLAPKNPFPSATDDVNAAIDYLKSRSRTLRIDSTRIVLVGRSAGGQLALQSGYTKNDFNIRGVVALYAPTDQIWGWEHPTNPRVYDSFATLRAFLNGEPSQIAPAYRAASPINYIGSHTIPTLLIHGSMDPLVSVRQSQRLDSALAIARRPHLLVEMPWATHGCDYVFNGPCGQMANFAIERFVAAVTR